MQDLASICAIVALKGLIGAVIGSFAVTCAMRAAAERPWATGRSACDHCHTSLGYAATTPIIGYAAARGRCRHCAARIDALHPAGELAGALILMTAPGDLAESVLHAGLGFCLLSIAVFDLKTFRIPNIASLTILLSGLILAKTQDRLAAALATVGCVWLAFTLLRARFRRSRNTDGLGGGDIKLMAASASWLAPEAAPWVVLIAALSALLWVKTRRIKSGDRLAFAPFIAVGVWSTVLIWSAS
jgi:leader peptidase (prepilin peptidase)/N-methyltransferase